jgi:hypothetical protein
MRLAINNCLKRKGIFISGLHQYYTKYAGFKVLTAVVMSGAIVWDIASCSPYVNRRFGGMYDLHLQGRKSAEEETRLQQVA